MLKKRVVAALAAAMVAGGVSAVEVNPGGKGDVLIAPLSMVGGGWESELRLVNTDTERSMVVKVAYHISTDSAEVLDFLVYLTPGDVWRGTAVKNSDGTFGVNSTDDSSYIVRSKPDSCPSDVADSAGFKADVGDTPMKSSIAADLTYVKVFQVRTFNTAGLNKPGTKKADLIKAYSTACSNNESIPVNGPTVDALLGDMTVSNAQNGNVMSLNLTALSNYRNARYAKVGEPTTFANSTATSKKQVEDAVWANNFAVPYTLDAGVSTYAVVTFPTKEEFIQSAGSMYFPGLTISSKKPARTPSLDATIWNESEEMLGTVGCYKSPCTGVDGVILPNELNLVEIKKGDGKNTASQLNTKAYSRGWVNLNLEQQTSTADSKPNWSSRTQSGAPAIVTYFSWLPKGSSVQGFWNYASKTQNPKDLTP